MQISCQYQYSLSYLHPHMWLPPDMIFVSPAFENEIYNEGFIKHIQNNRHQKNLFFSISLKPSLKQLLSVIDRYVHLFLCSQPILCRTKNGLFLSFLSTVRCSIPHSSQRSHPIHPTYSTTVLHQFEMAFFFFEIGCNVIYVKMLVIFKLRTARFRREATHGCQSLW